MSIEVYCHFLLNPARLPCRFKHLTANSVLLRQFLSNGTVLKSSNKNSQTVFRLDWIAPLVQDIGVIPQFRVNLIISSGSFGQWLFLLVHNCASKGKILGTHFGILYCQLNYILRNVWKEVLSILLIRSLITVIVAQHHFKITPYRQCVIFASYVAWNIGCSGFIW